jgi:hypothetical protein
MKDANVVGAMFVVIYSISMSMIMINIFLVIVIGAFEEVKRDIDKQPNDFEVVEFMKDRLSTFVGLKKPNFVTPVPVAVRPADDGMNEKQVGEFPNKVERMLDQINDLYFDGSLDIHNKEWLKKMYKEQKNQKKFD